MYHLETTIGIVRPEMKEVAMGVATSFILDHSTVNIVTLNE